MIYLALTLTFAVIIVAGLGRLLAHAGRVCFIYRIDRLPPRELASAALARHISGPDTNTPAQSLRSQT